MKKEYLIAAGLALAGIAGYFITKALGKKENTTTAKRTHHLTDAFARAKEHALAH